jgi:hypothetical protein
VTCVAASDNHLHGAQDSVLFRGSDLASLPASASLPWLPPPGATAAYASLAAAQLSPTGRGSAAAAWAPSLLLAPPDQALLLASVELQKHFYNDVLRAADGASGRRGGADAGLHTSARSVGRALLDHATNELEQHHAREYRACVSPAIQARQFAIAKGAGQRKLREGLPKGVRMCF